MPQIDTWADVRELLARERARDHRVTATGVARLMGYDRSNFSRLINADDASHPAREFVVRLREAVGEIKAAPASNGRKPKSGGS